MPDKVFKAVPFYDWVVRSVPNIPARRRLAVVLLLHAGLAAASLYFSLLLRFDFDFSEVRELAFGAWAVGLAFLRVAALVYYRSHVGLWRYVSVTDLVGVAKATTVSSALFVALVWAVSGFEGFPRSVFLIEWGVYIFLASGIRVSVRLWREGMRPAGPGHGSTRRLLVIGAGDAGAAFTAQAKSSPSYAVDPVGFVDDDESKIGKTIHGIPVYGAIDDVPELVRRLAVDMVVIAVPSATPEQRRSLVDVCRRAHVEFRILPGTDQLLQGNVAISKLRRVDISDLLGRPETELDYDAISDVIFGKTVLVTGAAGTIGSELSRRVLPFHPAELILVDHSENSLVLLEYELRSILKELGENGTTISARIADITSPESFRAITRRHQPDVVFHAAAHKHVFPMENAPAEAVVNNIGGTLNVAAAAVDCGASLFVLVSTDKAVDPTSTMGATKRVAELVASENGRNSSTRFVTVRFGNVLGSNASVVPIFQSQIERGGPVTVTHPDVERFFMSAPEAAGLILAAAAISTESSTYMLDMGVPVKIDSLARTMIELSGLVPGRDIEIQYTGLKPGEKFTESLISDREELVESSHEKVFLVRHSTPQSVDLERLEHFVSEVRSLDNADVWARIQDFVPEFRASGTVAVARADSPSAQSAGSATASKTGHGLVKRRIGKAKFLGG